MVRPVSVAAVCNRGRERRDGHIIDMSVVMIRGLSNCGREIVPVPADGVKQCHGKQQALRGHVSGSQILIEWVIRGILCPRIL